MWNKQLNDLAKLVASIESGRDRNKLTAEINRLQAEATTQRASVISAVRALNEAEVKRDTVERENNAARGTLVSLRTRIKAVAGEPRADEAQKQVDDIERQMNSARSMAGSNLAKARDLFLKEAQGLRKVIFQFLELRNRRLPHDLAAMIPNHPAVELNKLTTEVSAALANRDNWDAKTAHAVLLSLYARFRIFDTEYSLGEELRGRMNNAYGMLRKAAAKAEVPMPEKFNAGFEDWWALLDHAVASAESAAEVSAEEQVAEEAPVEAEALQVEEPASV